MRTFNTKTCLKDAVEITDPVEAKVHLKKIC